MKIECLARARSRALRPLAGCTLLCLLLLAHGPARFGALCTAAAQAQANPANADDTARRHYERGLALYEDGAYDAALGELVRAYELRPAPVLLYNIALVHRALNDHAAALQALRQYITASGKSLPEARRAEVDAQLTELEQRVAQVTVQVDVPGAEILVDQRLVGESPLREPLLINAGMRQVTVQHRDYAPQNRQLRLAGGDRVEQVFRLGATVAAGETRESTRSDEPSARSRRVRGLAISWGSTGALTITALACGISALVHDHALADTRESLAPDSAALHDDATRTRRLAITTDVFMVAALGAAAVSLWWTLRPEKRSDHKAAALNLRVGPGGVLLRAQY